MAGEEAVLDALFQKWMQCVDERCAQTEAAIKHLREELLGTPAEVVELALDVYPVGKPMPSDYDHPRGFMVLGKPVHPKVYRYVQSLVSEAGKQRVELQKLSGSWADVVHERLQKVLETTALPLSNNDAEQLRRGLRYAAEYVLYGTDQFNWMEHLPDGDNRH